MLSELLAVENTSVLVLDGHDAAGKTTLARMVADSLGGRYVKPFDGTLGDMIIWLYGRQHFELADGLSRAAVAKMALDNSDASLLVFDRHWMSMFTLLPTSLRKGWFPLPVTILCWADLPTTTQRLSDRGEDVGNPAEHEHFIQLYRDIANEFGVPSVDTSLESIEDSLATILRLAANMRPS